MSCKSFAFNTKPISVNKVLYKRLMEPENGGHTHTQSEYCNARAHARRALMNPYCARGHVSHWTLVAFVSIHVRITDSVCPAC